MTGASEPVNGARVATTTAGGYIAAASVCSKEKI